MNHNVSWSFTNSIVDILLDIFLAPDQSVCTYPGPECRSPVAIQLQRSSSAENNHDVLLRCDRHNLAQLNDTLCADVLAGSRANSSTSVLTFCQALSLLGPVQIEQVWSNACYIIQALASPLLSRSSDCNAGELQPPPPSDTPPLLRVAREAPNLKLLACNYNSWLDNNTVDAVLVTLCSDNGREEFVKQVCNNAQLMRKLLSDTMNSWLYTYCSNSSADLAYLVSHFCTYDQWLSQPTVPVGPFLLEFCMSLDGPRLTSLICEHTGFFMLLFSNPDNFQFMPNCTRLPPPLPFPNTDSSMLESCQYSAWHDLSQISTDVLLQCVRLDQSGFAKAVCSNKTFLNSLLSNPANDWLENHCQTSQTIPTPEPTQPLSISDWCDYHTWGERQVDVSVVGFCWHSDQLAFQKNVCCKASVLEKLLENPQNKWLVSVCTDIDDIKVLPQVGCVCPPNVSLSWRNIRLNNIQTMQYHRYKKVTR